MIFKNLEIYFLSASSIIRWGFTFIIVVAICALWYFFAYLPLEKKINRLRFNIAEHETLQQRTEHDQEHQNQQQKAIRERLWGAGSYNSFLKDLVNAGIAVKKVTVEKVTHYSGYHATEAKMHLEAPFEKLYQFIRKHHAHYLCLWNSIASITNSANLVETEADIIIYSK